MVAADYTISSSVQFAEKGTGGMGAIAGALFGGIGTAIAGGMQKTKLQQRYC